MLCPALGLRRNLRGRPLGQFGLSLVQVLENGVTRAPQAMNGPLQPLLLEGLLFDHIEKLGAIRVMHGPDHEILLRKLPLCHGTVFLSSQDTIKDYSAIKPQTPCGRSQDSSVETYPLYDVEAKPA
jgi:hypothetical protein